MRNEAEPWMPPQTLRQAASSALAQATAWAADAETP